MSKTLKRAGVVVAMFVVTVAGTRALQPGVSNPPTTSSGPIQLNPATSNALDAVLNRSCGDCHSNTMASRWYARVPPFSALMARGAREGRKAVNFSEWSTYSAVQRQAFLAASCTDVTLGKMPMKAYLRLRRDAQVSTQDVETICSAAREVESTSAASAGRPSPRDR